MTLAQRQRLAGISGLLAVLLGAFGAHALRPQFSPEQVHLWETAVFYQFIHTLVLLWLNHEPQRPPFAFVAFALGILLFSGSLYLLALTGIRWLGAITPFGGIAFLVGWFSLARSNSTP